MTYACSSKADVPGLKTSSTTSAIRVVRRIRRRERKAPSQLQLLRVNDSRITRPATNVPAQLCIHQGIGAGPRRFEAHPPALVASSTSICCSCQSLPAFAATRRCSCSVAPRGAGEATIRSRRRAQVLALARQQPAATRMHSTVLSHALSPLRHAGVDGGDVESADRDNAVLTPVHGSSLGHWPGRRSPSRRASARARGAIRAASIRSSRNCASLLLCDARRRSRDGRAAGGDSHAVRRLLPVPGRRGAPGRPRVSAHGRRAGREAGADPAGGHL